MGKIVRPYHRSMIRTQKSNPSLPPITVFAVVAAFGRLLMPSFSIWQAMVLSISRQLVRNIITFAATAHAGGDGDDMGSIGCIGGWHLRLQLWCYGCWQHGQGVRIFEEEGLIFLLPWPHILLLSTKHKDSTPPDGRQKQKSEGSIPIRDQILDSYYYFFLWYRWDLR